jgi:N-acetylglucosaminyl-diphospho-decaprenol L-rhamnosyltransferase
MPTPVTAVVTTHNARATLLRCLDSLRAAGPIAEILLFDSGSTDGCTDDLNGRHSDIVVERIPTNVGPCVTRNLGLRKARSPRVLFVDDDMILEPGVIERLAKALDDHPAAALAGPTMVFAGSADVIQYAGGTAHFAGLPHLLRLGQRPERLTSTHAVDVLTAGCLLADRERVLSVGGFDEDYFYLAEDVDLSLRLRQKGHELLIVPAAVVQNVGGTAGVSMRDDAYPARRVELHSRNRWLLIGKLYDPWTIFILLPGLAVYETAWLVFAMFTGHLRAYMRGKWRASTLLLRSFRRKREHARKEVPDRELLGAPKMTFTRTALAQPFAERGASMLDGWLRLWWVVLRGALQ